MEDIDVSVEARLLDMQPQGTADDSQTAAEIMAGLDIACIITLGGDGTNRVVTKACGDIPLLPISTGTNNVFPYMIEGTLAGLAAGFLATKDYPRKQIVRQMPRLEIYRKELKVPTFGSEPAEKKGWPLSHRGDKASTDCVMPAI